VATSNNTDSAAEALLAEAEAAEAEAAAAEAEAAQAEAAAAEAEAAQERARAEAEADAAEAEAKAAAAEVTETAESSATVEDESAEEFADFDDDDDDAPVVDDYRSFLWRTVAAGVGVLLLVALLAVSGWLIWQHHQAVQRAERATEFATAARQGVVNLMSLNFNHAQDDLQRVIDSTTGSFRQDFEKSKNDFASVMNESKVVATSEVKATGVESVDDNSAVVLVAAASQVANSASLTPTPRAWRLSVTVQQESDGIKMSKVEFVP
jgi:Mce-associated membrane protein